MTIFTGKELAAAVFSPLAAGPGMFIGTLIHDPSFIQHQQWWLSLLQPFYFILLTLPVALVGMLVLGVPSYLMLKAINLNYPLLVGISGGPLSYLVFRVMGGGDGYGDDMWFTIILSCGFMVSITAAFIIRLEKKSNKSLNLIGAKNAPPN